MFFKSTTLQFYFIIIWIFFLLLQGQDASFQESSEVTISYDQDGLHISLSLAKCQMAFFLPLCPKLLPTPILQVSRQPNHRGLSLSFLQSIYFRKFSVSTSLSLLLCPFEVWIFLESLPSFSVELSFSGTWKASL